MIFSARNPRWADPQMWTRTLEARLAIRHPQIIDSDGRKLNDEQLILPAAFAQLLIASCDLKPPHHGAGDYLTCVREPAIAPLLSASQTRSVPQPMRSRLVRFPESLEEIEEHLLAVTWCTHAQGEFDWLFGYSISDVAKLLDALRQGGPDGAMFVATMQLRFAAATALRHHDFMKRRARQYNGGAPVNVTDWFAPILLAARAATVCSDVLETAFEKHVMSAATAKMATAACNYMALVINDLDKAQRSANIEGVAKVAGHAVNLISRLATAFEEVTLNDLSRPMGMRISAALINKLAQNKAPADRLELDRVLDTHIQANFAAGLEVQPMLLLPGAQHRLRWVTGFDTTGLFKLVWLRRFDDVLTRFPWLSARLETARHVPLGLLGMLSEIHEWGRSCEIGLDLIQRGRQPGNPVTKKKMKQSSGSKAAIKRQVAQNGWTYAALLNVSISYRALECAMGLSTSDFAKTAGTPLHAFSHGQHQPQRWYANSPAEAYNSAKAVVASQIAEMRSGTHQHDFCRYYGHTIFEVLVGALMAITGEQLRRTTPPPTFDPPAPNVTDLDRTSFEFIKKILIALDPTRATVTQWQNLIISKDRSGTHREVAGAATMRRNFGGPVVNCLRYKAAVRFHRFWSRENQTNHDHILRRILQRRINPKTPIGDLFIPWLWFSRRADYHIYALLQWHIELSRENNPAQAEVDQFVRWAPDLFARFQHNQRTAIASAIIALAPSWLALDPLHASKNLWVSGHSGNRSVAQLSGASRVSGPSGNASLGSSLSQ